MLYYSIVPYSIILYYNALQPCISVSTPVQARTPLHNPTHSFPS